MGRGGIALAFVGLALLMQGSVMYLSNKINMLHRDVVGVVSPIYNPYASLMYMVIMVVGYFMVFIAIFFIMSKRA